MSVDGSLFGDDEPVEGGSAPPTPPVATGGEGASPLPDWQVQQLRQALDARALSMDERQRKVSEYAGRPVKSLRELTSREARVVAERLASERAGGGAQGSSWDDREEDTWIDRL